MAESAFHRNVKVVIAKRFVDPALASIVQARLEQEGISSFLSNSNTSQLIPFNEGGVILHVNETDLEEVHKIIRNIESELSNPVDDDFRDADMEEIMYQKNLYEKDKRIREASPKTLIIALAIIAIIILFFALFF